MARDQRRLAAIVSADVVGYSLLMGRDESATLAGLKAHRQQLIDPKIAEYGGRIVKTTGDGLLLEFPSVVDAVRCSVDVQRGMAERNAGVPPEQRIEFRIGINVGDIIIDGEDIFGDGVNVAARLQTLAEPGGICVSKVVRDQVLDKLSFAFEDLGAQEVKNIVRPVEVYRVDLGAQAPRAFSHDRRRWQRLSLGFRRQWVAIGALALGAAGIALWTLPQFWKAAAPASPPFSIAILPFAAAVANEQFAEAVTEDLTGALGHVRYVSIVSHSLAATYKGKSIDARAVGRELRVRYLVEGEVRGDGERISVNAQLVDTANATQVWSDNLEVRPAQTTRGPDGLIALLTSRVREAVNRAEIRRAREPMRPGATAIDLALHGAAEWYNAPCATASDCVMAIAEARKTFDQALRLDPNLLFAMNLKAATLDGQLWQDLHADHDRLVSELDEVSGRAVVGDPEDPTAWANRADALSWQWRWQAALEANARSRNLDPFRPYGFQQLAGLMVRTGKPAEALASVDQALVLDPQNNGSSSEVWLYRCRAYLALGRYDEATAACEKAVALDDWWLGHTFLVAAYSQKDETAKAEAEKMLLLKQQPGMTIADLKAQRLSNHPAFLEQNEKHLYAGLRKAGIPEK